MSTYYIDHTEFKVSPLALKNDTIVLGGILIEHQDELRLSNLIREIKGNYFNPDLPIKYNMRDLRKKFEGYGYENQFDICLKESAQWRKELFSRSLDIDYRIFISIIQEYDTKKKTKQINKHDVIGFAFNNVLMRVAKHVQDKDLMRFQVVSDWPESNNPKPFNNEYYYAFWRGQTPEGQKYFSGPLKNLGFHDTILFASMNHSNMLQFADLIIGAMRDFLSCGLAGREYAVGKELTELIVNKFHGFPDKVSYGLSISSGNQELKARINSIMQPYLTSRASKHG